jgi:O-antigen/teichoic acid export membrane protein
MLKRVAKALNATLFGHLIARAGSFVLVPLFLSRWSASLYGEYMALFASVSYLSGLDIGMQLAAVNRLTKAYAREDLDEYRLVQHSALAFYLCVATGTTLVAIFLSILLPIPRWIGVRLTRPSIATSVIVLLAIYVLWSLPGRLITSTYQTMGNLARSQWVNNAQQLLGVLMAGVILLMGGGMLSIAFSQVAVFCALLLLVLWDVHSHAPQLFPGIAGAKFSVLKELFRPSLLFALLVVANLVAYQGAVLLVSATLGGVAVAVFSVSRTLINVIREVLYSFGVALWPDLARFEAKGELEKLRGVHRLMIFGTCVVAIALGTCVWFEGALIITIWTRGHLVPDVTLLRLFVAFTVLQTPWVASSAVSTASNHHRIYAIAFFASTVIGLTLATLLIARFGMSAVPLGLTVGEALCCYHFVIRATCRLIHEPYAPFAVRLWSGLGVLGALVMTSGWLVHHMIPGLVLVRWVAMGLTTLTVSAAGAWLLWLSHQDRVLVVPKLRPLFAMLNAKV